MNTEQSILSLGLVQKMTGISKSALIRARRNTEQYDHS